MPQVGVARPGRKRVLPSAARRSKTRRPARSWREGATGGMASRWPKRIFPIVFTSAVDHRQASRPAIAVITAAAAARTASRILRGLRGVFGLVSVMMPVLVRSTLLALPRAGPVPGPPVQHRGRDGGCDGEVDREELDPGRGAEREHPDDADDLRQH